MSRCGGRIYNIYVVATVKVLILLLLCFTIIFIIAIINAFIAVLVKSNAKTGSSVLGAGARQYFVVPYTVVAGFEPSSQ